MGPQAVSCEKLAFPITLSHKWLYDISLLSVPSSVWGLLGTGRHFRRLLECVGAALESDLAGSHAISGYSALAPPGGKGEHCHKLPMGLSRLFH